jgi:hypothetical protein
MSRIQNKRLHTGTDVAEPCALLSGGLEMDRVAPTEKTRTLADCIHNLVGLLIPALFLLLPAPGRSLSHHLTISLPLCLLPAQVGRAEAWGIADDQWIHLPATRSPCRT